MLTPLTPADEPAHILLACIDQTKSLHGYSIDDWHARLASWLQQT